MEGAPVLAEVPPPVPPHRQPVGVEAGLPAAEVDALLVRLRSGDETAFAAVVHAWSPRLLRVARTYVSTDASAQEVVQETWLAVVRGLGRFEGRSSLRTWVFSILANVGRTRGVRESRSVPWSSLVPAERSGPFVDSRRFRGPADEWPCHWTPVGSPQPWQRQRTVVALRDVHGLSSDEVCAALAISAANQRVLLHRGRARMRAALENC